MKAATRPWPARGSVYLVRFDPAEGHELNKSRPAVVVSNDDLNELAATVVVIPITTGSYPYRNWINIHPPEGGLHRASAIVPEQVRSLDKRRLLRQLGDVSPKTMARIEAAVRDVFGLPEGRVI